ncbi:hypothetical protein acsn021_41750 [Anaerocolumna cellulosilytica]|uniref:Uncharacterized protein n=1 Tax=Anaerocolumna cellulosilytica TaxID=433286 RepID=A0A6S6R3E0_9FIRM|nr:hypothetical protein [Anaerocolumna cellulosilytica]BCJ96606.1 hypothetical protein acsn021_41750 [Anaerocolumna cellulosilytica]
MISLPESILSCFRRQKIDIDNNLAKSYNKIVKRIKKEILRGRVRFPTGGIVRDLKSCK